MTNETINQMNDLFQVAGKRDKEQEQEAQEWIEAITGESFTGSFEDSLRDGILLCKVMNKLHPGIVQKINVSGGDYKMMDNISVSFDLLFLWAFSDIWLSF